MSGRWRNLPISRCATAQPARLPMIRSPVRKTGAARPPPAKPRPCRISPSIRSGPWVMTLSPQRLGELLKATARFRRERPPPVRRRPAFHPQEPRLCHPLRAPAHGRGGAAPEHRAARPSATPGLPREQGLRLRPRARSRQPLPREPHVPQAGRRGRVSHGAGQGPLARRSRVSPRTSRRSRSSFPTTTASSSSPAPSAPARPRRSPRWSPGSTRPARTTSSPSRTPSRSCRPPGAATSPSAKSAGTPGRSPPRSRAPCARIPT